MKTGRLFKSLFAREFKSEYAKIGILSVPSHSQLDGMAIRQDRGEIKYPSNSRERSSNSEIYEIINSVRERETQQNSSVTRKPTLL